MKTNFKKRLWISGSIIIGSLLIGIGGLYYFSGSLNASANTFLNDRAAAQAQTAALGKLAELQQDAPSAVVYQDAINKLLPDQYALINFPTWLSPIAQADGVTVNATLGDNLNPPSGGTPGTAPFSLNAQGSPAGIAAFLEDIESKSQSFLLTVSAFDMTSQANGSAELTAQGYVYFQ